MTAYEESMRAALDARLPKKLLSGLSPLFFDSVASTNLLCKRLAAEGAAEGTLVFAEEQTGGHGRFARPFYSPRGGGLYMSLLLRPALSPTVSTEITTAAAVAVAEAVEACLCRPVGIKWVNDVYIDERKVCGILTEGGMSADGGMAYAVLGIGVNVIAPEGGFPDTLAQTAGAVLPAGTPRTAVADMAADILARFLGYYARLSARPHVDAYRARSVLLGKRVRLFRGIAAADKSGEGECATVLGLDDDLALIVRYDDGRVETVFSGEVGVTPFADQPRRR